MIVDNEPAGPLPVPDNVRVAEFAPLTRALRLNADAVGGGHRAERFAPDGRCLARLDHNGVLSLSAAAPGTPS